MSKKELVASIDIGAHAVRMLIAEIQGDLSYEILEDLEQPVPLGANVFQRGRISNKSIRMMADILRNYRLKMEEYGVSKYKAIATSAVREAGNAHIFVERIEHLAGINIEVFEGVNEARLDFLTISHDVPARFGFARKRMLCADIGTGACQISIYDQGLITLTETIRTGTLRILEELSDAPSAADAESLVPHISRAFSQLEHVCPSMQSDSIIAMGSSVRALALMHGRRSKARKVGATEVKKDNFTKIYELCLTSNIEDLVKKYDLEPDMAEALLPCCTIIDYLFKVTGAENLIVPMTSTKNALLLDYIYETSGERDYFELQLTAMVRRVAEKFHCNDDYSAATVSFTERLFVKLSELHGLSDKDLILLKASAALHRAGLFINNQAYHQHTYYLVSSSDLPGLTASEKELVAMVARYHRRSMPKSSHLPFVRLNIADQQRVIKLSALLRLACALADSCSTDEKLRIRLSPGIVHLRLSEEAAEAMTVSKKNKYASIFSYVFSSKLLVN